MSRIRVSQNWLDRAVGAVSPSWQLTRFRSRVALTVMQRHYEAAADGWRTEGWKRASGDANTVNAPSLGKIRDLARDLVRNNRQMRQAVRTIANHTVGWGISASIPNVRLMEAWKAWAETTACDADGRDDLYGLQKLVMRGVAENGEMLVRRRWRRLEDGYPLPVQLQVLEPDFLDTSKTIALPNGGLIVQGVEFDALGNRVAYWLFPSHPGSSISSTSTILSPSRRVPAKDVQHIFERDRAGQVRSVSWFASLILPAKDLDEYCDAQLMKQKIAACLAVIMTDDGTSAGLGTATTDSQTRPIDQIAPGAIIRNPTGSNVEVVQPPTVGDYASFTSVEDRKNAKALGLSYEDFTGDYSQVNFSSARMSRLEHYENVYDWRWRMLIPQFCGPAWGWAMEAAQLLGITDVAATAKWTAPPIPMIEPDKEGLAYQRLVRNGLMTQSEAQRERGIDPADYLTEREKELKEFDQRGIWLDSDPRRMSQAGLTQERAGKKAETAAENDEGANEGKDDAA